MQIKIQFDNLICKKMAKVQIKMIKTLVNLQFLSILIIDILFCLVKCVPPILFITFPPSLGRKHINNNSCQTKIHFRFCIRILFCQLTIK